VARLLGRAVVRVVPLGGAYRVELTGGDEVVAKRHGAASAVNAEVAGLRWLRAAAGPPISSLAAGTDTAGPRNPDWERVHPTNPSERTVRGPGGPPDSTLPGGADRNAGVTDEREQVHPGNPSERTVHAAGGPPESTLRQGADRNAGAGGKWENIHLGNPSEGSFRGPGGPPMSTLPGGGDSGARLTGEREGVHPGSPSERAVHAPGGPPDLSLPVGADSFGVRVPAVLGFDDEWLVVEFVATRAGSFAAAEEFGWGLASLHGAGAAAFGSAPPGGPVDAWVGLAPMRNLVGVRWPEWFAEHRVLPYVRAGVDLGVLEESHVIEGVCERIGELAGPDEPPARLHGDLWSGNVLWGDHVWLIDPAAHGGHRESDLAMLRLFGCPHLERIVAAYDEAAPLADGWRERVALHQLFPLLVHAVLFGGGYGAQAVAAARSLA
jgi:fructosamine-3-kinase